MLATAALTPLHPLLPFVANQLAELRVFVADDHSLYRRVVTRAVERHPGLAVVGEASNGDAALRGILETEPDVALLDLRMPGLDGLEVCQRIRTVLPDISVIVLTAFDDGDTPDRAAAAGATACLGKDATHSEICDALLRAGDGTPPPASALA